MSAGDEKIRDRKGGGDLRIEMNKKGWEKKKKVKRRKCVTKWKRGKIKKQTWEYIESSLSKKNKEKTLKNHIYGAAV